MYSHINYALLAAAPAANAKRKPNALESMGLAAASALFAVNFTHPIEVCKTRMQIGEFSITQFLKTEGVLSFWKGIQAAWLREASYTSIKLGLYTPVRALIGANDKDAPFVLKFAAGAISGSLGSCVGNPFDVLKTLMMADSKRKAPIQQLAKEMLEKQGISGFYRGIQANVSRACVLNGTKMACYDKLKTIVVEKTGLPRRDPRTQFMSAIGAGFFMTCTVSPFDMMRTRLMNQPTDKKLYDGFVDCFTKILRNEGPLAFYRGFLPIWGRFAPQATIQLVAMDTLLNFTGFETI